MQEARSVFEAELWVLPCCLPSTGKSGEEGVGAAPVGITQPQKHSKVGITQPACAEPSSRNGLLLVSRGGGYHLLLGMQ